MKMKGGTVIVVLAVLISVFIIYYVLKGMQSKKDNSGFYPSLYKWVQEHEGYHGHSHLDASVGGYAPGTDVSVNMGVTWGTYKRLAPVLGYTATVSDFLNLSQARWIKIFRHIISDGDSFSKNKVIAAYIGLWYWGGWRQSYVSSEQVKDALKGTASQQMLNLINLRKHYFTVWGQHHPDEPNVNGLVAGWQHRADDFKKFIPYA